MNFNENRRAVAPPKNDRPLVWREGTTIHLRGWPAAVYWVLGVGSWIAIALLEGWKVAALVLAVCLLLESIRMVVAHIDHRRKLRHEATKGEH